MGFYTSSDYAGFGVEGFSCYYGYEVVDDQENWCFRANVGAEEIIIPFPELDVKDMFDCQACLMSGIAQIFERYELKERTNNKSS